jgi:molybdate transport system regulatory protein
VAVQSSKPKLRKPHPKRESLEGAHIGDLRVGGRVWVEKDGRTYLAWGRVVLLERIEQCGSISAAARSMGISYRHAWLLVEQTNALAPAPLVVAQKGGKKGGGASLTQEGKQAVQGFWRLVEKFKAFLQDVSDDAQLITFFSAQGPSLLNR